MKIIKNLILVLLIPALFQACVTQKKVEKYLDGHPEVSSLYCATKYPVKDSIGKPQIRYVPADNKNLTKELDSVAQVNASLKSDVDSLMSLSIKDTSAVGAKYRKIITGLNDRLSAYSKQVNKLRDEYKPCAPDTAFVTETHYLSNTAKERYLQGKWDVTQAKLESVTKWRNIFLISSIVLLLALAALILINVFKK